MLDKIGNQLFLSLINKDVPSENLKYWKIFEDPGVYHKVFITSKTSYKRRLKIQSK